MENSEAHGDTETSSQLTSIAETLRDTMIQLDKLQAFIDAIELITDAATDKTGCIVWTLARESAEMCTKAHTTIDLLELNIEKT